MQVTKVALMLPWGWFAGAWRLFMLGICLAGCLTQGIQLAIGEIGIVNNPNVVTGFRVLQILFFLIAAVSLRDRNQTPKPTEDRALLWGIGAALGIVSGALTILLAVTAEVATPDYVTLAHVCTGFVSVAIGLGFAIYTWVIWRQYEKSRPCSLEEDPRVLALFCDPPLTRADSKPKPNASPAVLLVSRTVSPAGSLTGWRSESAAQVFKAALMRTFDANPNSVGPLVTDWCSAVFNPQGADPVNSNGTLPDCSDLREYPSGWLCGHFPWLLFAIAEQPQYFRSVVQAMVEFVGNVREAELYIARYMLESLYALAKELPARRAEIAEAAEQIYSAILVRRPSAKDALDSILERFRLEFEVEPLIRARA